jgi:membrane associated rhomboid family serine protease
MWLSYYGFIDVRFAADMEKNFPLTPIDIIEFKTEKFYTLFTSMFLHAGLVHLFGNMLYLYIFGDNVEDALGHSGYLAFYLVCGLAASAAHIMSVISVDNPLLYNVPVVGASGAISGVLGAYLVLYPKSKILTLVIYGWAVLVPIPAFIFLGIWFLMQWLLGMYDIIFFKGLSGVAYWAHIGGFIAGMILALIFGLERKKAREKRFRF